MAESNQLRGRYLIASWVLLSSAGWVDAATLTLKNGMSLTGREDRISAIAENPLTPSKPAGGVDSRLIVLVDDELRRTFFPFHQLAAVAADDTHHTPIRIWQRVATQGRQMAAIGGIQKVTPFNEHGRRTVSLMTARGRMDVVQGITEITPVYTRLQGIVGADRSVVWDMRIATSAIPSETLRTILLTNAEGKGADARRDIVRLLWQAERYRDASRELQLAMKEYPELRELETLNQQLIQLGADRLRQEIQMRGDAGQHERAQYLLANFPASKGVANENLVRAHELLQDYRRAGERIQLARERFDKYLASIQDPAGRKQVERIRDELQGELNLNNVNRMADFLRLADDPDFSAEQKLALAISGWLLGSGAGTENFAVAVSLCEIRDLARRYLRLMGADDGHERQEILAQIMQREGGTPGSIAKLLEQMRPPLDVEAEEGDIPGYYPRVVVPSPEPFSVRYAIQLPPEYDPYRRYPAVVTLHGAGSTPSHQVDWWAGEYNEQLQTRAGLAARHGYIVIAPYWAEDHQTQYEYSAREHAAVLLSLRDALRRFSIDSDRVFLSGHSLGGDAAWDIALAHPDLWAGLIAIVASADYGEKTSPKYVTMYGDNARRLPMYFVFGELDGNKLNRGAVPLNRYMEGNQDVLVVQYQGRGHEHFYDEIQRLFTWMQLHRRDFYPPEFDCSSMRAWDGFFWYLELERFPERTLVSPVGWPPMRGVRALQSTASFGPGNRIRVVTGAGKAVVWVAPEMVDLQQPVEISARLGRVSSEQTLTHGGDVETLLEDARTRADRQHPFWARAEFETGGGD